MEENKTPIPKIEKSKKSKAASWTFGTGRRKTSIARVAIKKGKNEVTVNDKPFERYFVDSKALLKLATPLRLVDREKDFDISVKVYGGGTNGQLDALVHGLAHALINYDESMRPTLAKAGLLTRDPRAKERRKYGHAGKARAMRQSPKR